MTTAEAKGHLRVDDSDEDTLIDVLVSAATEAVEELTRRALLEQTWQARFAKLPTSGVELPRPPLIGVERVEYWPDVTGDVLRGRAAKLVVVDDSDATLDRVLTGATTAALTDGMGFSFEDAVGTVDTVGAQSTTLTGLVTAGVSAGTYYVDYYADSTTVWSRFLDWDVEALDLPARLLPRCDDLPDVESEHGAAWSVRYKAGYGTVASDVPDRLVAAVKLLVGHLFEHRGEDPEQVPVPDGIRYLVNDLVVPHRL